MKQIINDQRNENILLKNSIEPDILNEVSINLLYAIIISRIRRSGKSTLLQQPLTKFPDFYYFNF